ncbi:MAG: lactate racemase domain-containing protein [Limnochordia bacterium]
MSEIQLPPMVRIGQHHNAATHVDNPEAVAGEALRQAGIAAKVNPGDRIAVACGSRGIGSYAHVVKGVIDALKTVGADPVIIPAMGSHGGATSEGQTAVLAEASITEQSMGAPIMASMDVVELGTIPGGPPVCFARQAMEMDGVVLVNRVKPHTDFAGDLGSGLIKMLVIGLGKARGAQAIHAYGVRGLKEMVPEAAKMILSQVNVLPSIAIIENASGRPAIIRALDADHLPEGEKELMNLARAHMARLPVEQLDLLVVDKMGKDISGSGMDTNVIGRLGIAGEADFESPRISRVVVLDLSAASHGNATGVGLADVITERLRAKIDEKTTYINTVTSTFLERARLPVSMPTDREAIEVGLRCAWQPDTEAARIIRVSSTLELDQMFVSIAVWEELRQRPDIETLSRPTPWQFSAAGELSMPFTPDIPPA